MSKILNRRNRIILAIGDRIIGFALKPFLFFSGRRRKLCGNYHKILLISLAYVGDTVLAFPVIKALKERFTDAKISFITCSQAAELLKGNPFIDEIISYDAFWFYKKPTKKAFSEYGKIIKKLRVEEFDLAIDFRADIRDILLIGFFGRAKRIVSYGFGGGKYLLTEAVPEREHIHKMEFHLDLAKAIGAETSNPEFKLYLNDNDRNFAEAFLRRLGINNEKMIVGIHPGARVPLRRWPLYRFGEVGKRLLDEYHVRVLLIGPPDEKEMVKNLNEMMNNKGIDISGKTTFRELASILERLTLFICNETGTMHVAAAVGTTTISLFGPQLIEKFAPRGDKHIAISKEIECRPCAQVKCVRNLNNNDWCLGRIGVEDVMAAVKKLLKV